MTMKQIKQLAKVILLHAMEQEIEAVERGTIADDLTDAQTTAVIAEMLRLCDVVGDAE